MDTTPILGRGAVKDTYNLIGDGIRKIGQVLARLQDISPEQWAAQHDFTKYWDASSLKGEAGIEWNDETQRRVFLNGLVVDAERILLLADTLAKRAVEHAPKIVEASALLPSYHNTGYNTKAGASGKERKRQRFLSFEDS